MRFRMNKVQWIVVVSLLATVAMSSVGAAQGQITVGSQEYAEHLIVGHMIAQLLEADGYEVTRTFGLGGPQIVFSAMQRGEVDVWMSYSGTIASVVLGKELESGLDPNALYAENQRELQERFNVVHLDTLGFNNTYVFAVQRDFAEQHNLTKVSDLIPIANRHRLAGSVNFMSDRPDGVRGVEERYGMRFARNVTLETSFMYPALESGQVDVIVGFSTHGQIAAMDLVMLEDDRNLFPPYWAGILVRGEVLEENPGLLETLDRLTGTIDETTMAALNYEVEGPQRRDPAAVATEYLQELGLID